MSLILFLSTMAAVTPAVAQPSTFKRPAAHCPRTTSYYAWSRDRALTPRKLGELPPANAYRTVLRLVNGCEVPVVVRYGVGR